jgi:hypothetical protein
MFKGTPGLNGQRRLWQDSHKMTIDTPSGTKDEQKSWFSDHWRLGIVLGIALIIRLALYILYAPVSFSDSRTYQRLAEQISQGWINYDGTRTPGYPAFMAVFRTDQAVWFVQMGMGIVITLLIYYLGWQLGVDLEKKKRLNLAALAALAHTLNIGQLFFESSLLSETLATFFLILTIAGWVWGFRVPKARNIWLAGALGLTSALAILTRGLFILLPFITVLMIWLYWSEKPGGHETGYSKALPGKRNLELIWKNLVTRLKKTFPVLLAYSIPFSLLIGSWIGFIRVYYNQWGLETMGGFHLIQNTGTFFEYVPDEYAAIRDTYLKYRDAKIDQSGTQTNVIWKAIPEMMDVSGLGFYDLSRLVGKISVDLIREHPDLYLRNVVKGWWLFWRAPVYWSPDAVQYSTLPPFLEIFIFIERLLLWAFNSLFLITSLLLVWPPFRRSFHPSPIHGYLLGIILSTSILQSFLDHGDNPRFLIPMQSLVVLWGLWFMFRYLSKDKNSRIIIFK